MTDKARRHSRFGIRTSTFKVYKGKVWPLFTSFRCCFIWGRNAILISFWTYTYVFVVFLYLQAHIRIIPSIVLLCLGRCMAQETASKKCLSHVTQSSNIIILNFIREVSSSILSSRICYSTFRVSLLFVIPSRAVKIGGHLLPYSSKFRT
jgi:hypothetical protein